MLLRQACVEKGASIPPYGKGASGGKWSPVGPEASAVAGSHSRAGRLAARATAVSVCGRKEPGTPGFRIPGSSF